MQGDCMDSDTVPRDRVIDELVENWLVSIATFPRFPRFPRLPLSRNACALRCRDTCALLIRSCLLLPPPVTPALSLPMTPALASSGKANGRPLRQRLLSPLQ